MTHRPASNSQLVITTIHSKITLDLCSTHDCMPVFVSAVWHNPALASTLSCQCSCPEGDEEEVCGDVQGPAQDADAGVKKTRFRDELFQEVMKVSTQVLHAHPWLILS